MKKLNKIDLLKPLIIVLSMIMFFALIPEKQYGKSRCAKKTGNKIKYGPYLTEDSKYVPSLNSLIF